MGQKPRADRWWHTSVNASIPICMSPPFSAYSMNRPSSSKEKKTSKSLEVEKSLRQKKMLVEKSDEKREPDGVFPLSRGSEGVLFLGFALFSASKD